MPSHGARPVHLIITMIKWIRTSRLSIKNSLSSALALLGLSVEEVKHALHGAVPARPLDRGTSPIRICGGSDPRRARRVEEVERDLELGVARRRRGGGGGGGAAPERAVRGGEGERVDDGREAPVVDGPAGALPGIVGVGQAILRAGAGGGWCDVAWGDVVELIILLVTAVRDVFVGRGSLGKGGSLWGGGLASGPDGRSHVGEDAVGLVAEVGEQRHGPANRSALDDPLDLGKCLRVRHSKAR